MQVKQMHKYVLLLVTVWVLFSSTLMIAILRVTESDKFGGFHLNSWDLDNKQQNKYAK